MPVEIRDEDLDSLEKQIAAYEAQVCSLYKSGFFLRAAHPAALDSSDGTPAHAQIVQVLAGRALYPDTIEDLIAIAQDYDFPFKVVPNPQTQEFEIYFSTRLGYGREELYGAIALDLEAHPQWKYPQSDKGFCIWKKIPTNREHGEYKKDQTETIQFLEALGIKFRISFNFSEPDPQATFLVEKEALAFLARVENDASNNDYHQTALLVDTGTTADNPFYRDYIATRQKILDIYGPVRSAAQ